MKHLLIIYAEVKILKKIKNPAEKQLLKSI